jgi:Uma2 family endonuclease
VILIVNFTLTQNRIYMGFPSFKYTTPEAYLTMEMNAPEKHEYFEGSVYAMAGATDDHIFIVDNLTSEIKSFLKGKDCKSYSSELRVTTPHFESYMYPDVSIICGKAEKKAGVFNTATNPSVIIEVTSRSTEKYDRGYKQIYYLQIPSLKEYIIIDSLKCKAEINRKQENGTWEKIVTDDMEDSIFIETINMKLPMKDIYFEVSFEDNK